MTHPCQRIQRLADTVDELQLDCKSTQTSRPIVVFISLVRGEVTGAIKAAFDKKELPPPAPGEEAGVNAGMPFVLDVRGLFYRTHLC